MRDSVNFAAWVEASSAHPNVSIKTYSHELDTARAEGPIRSAIAVAEHRDSVPVAGSLAQNATKEALRSDCHFSLTTGPRVNQCLRKTARSGNVTRSSRARGGRWGNGHYPGSQQSGCPDEADVVALAVKALTVLASLGAAPHQAKPGGTCRDLLRRRGASGPKPAARRCGADGLRRHLDGRCRRRLRDAWPPAKLGEAWVDDTPLVQRGDDRRCAAAGDRTLARARRAADR